MTGVGLYLFSKSYSLQNRNNYIKISITIAKTIESNPNENYQQTNNPITHKEDGINLHLRHSHSKSHTIYHSSGLYKADE